MSGFGRPSGGFGCSRWAGCLVAVLVAGIVAEAPDLARGSDGVDASVYAKRSSARVAAFRDGPGRLHRAFDQYVDSVSANLFSRDLSRLKGNDACELWTGWARRRWFLLWPFKWMTQIEGLLPGVWLG